MNLLIFIKRVNLFEHLCYFLKNIVILKGFEFYLDLEKINGSFKIFLISLHKGVPFPQIFLERDPTLHCRTHMCIHFSYKNQICIVKGFDFYIDLEKNVSFKKS